MNTPYQDELLTILQEECGEVIVAISKLKRFGIYSTSPSLNNLDKLINELGDVSAMIDLLVESGMVKKNDIDLASHFKKSKVVKWMKNKKA